MMKRLLNEKKFLLVYLLSLIFSHSIAGINKGYVFEYITNNNGLTNNTVYDICQDSKGFMWFATEVGLNRYDGQNVKQYYNSNSNPSLTNTFQCLEFTSDGYLFAGTPNGLLVYNSNKDIFELVSSSKAQLSDHIVSIHQGYNSELLVCTVNNGTFVFNYKTNQFRSLKGDDFITGTATDKKNNYWAFSRYTVYRYDHKGELIRTYKVPLNQSNSAISCIKTDKLGNVLIGTINNGVFIFDPKFNQFNQLVVCKGIKMNYVRTIEDGSNPDEYWVGTEGGLYILHSKQNSYIHYDQSFDNKHTTINDNAIYKIYHNKQGVFFVGTYFGGINMTNTSQIGFNTIIPEKSTGHLQGKAISMIAKAPDGKLWIATEDAGIAIFNKETYLFKHMQFNEKDPETIPANNVHALLMDGKVCWAGYFMGGISKIDITTNKVKRFIQNPNDLSIINNFVFALHFLSPDSILVGTQLGADIFNKKTGTFSKFRENEFASCFVYDIFTAPDGKIWFCTYNNGIFVLNKTKVGLMQHFHKGDQSGLTSNSIISYCVDNKQQIWIGTRDKGLLKFSSKKQQFESCKPNMLIDNVIYGIVQDNRNYYWISTNKGISRLNFKDSTAVHFNVKQGISSNQSNYKSYFKDNNIIYFGSVSGLTWFNPETIIIRQDAPTVYFTNLQISNEIIQPDSAGILKKQIDLTRQLILKHNQSSITIEYATINYFSNDIAYQYYLDGLEDKWSPLIDRNQANYTNLAPGHYVFHLRAINKINNIISPERLLEIDIKPPFWAAWYAYLCYFILLSAIAYYFYTSYIRRSQEKMVLAIEKLEKENIKLLHQHKMNFFTYISHEFKTPLSIIIASIEMLKQKTDTSRIEIQESIERSANRLLFLINQLMEFRRIETDHAVIHYTKGDIIDFSNQIINIYRPLLEKKNIELKLSISCSKAEITFDYDKLEKIITNLLTNAVKYTPHNGVIQVSLDISDNQIFFSVEDSGKGISEKEKEKIFEVFYSDGFSNEIIESSGVGLALTSSLVKLLKGQITVQSKPGKGSVFKLVLPYDENVENVGDKITSATTITDEIMKQESGTEVEKNVPQNEIIKEFTMVIAEDNRDLLMLLNKNFKEKYHVKCFENGKDAWEYILIKIPDIVITDIMMPLMSGIELCQKIKTDINLCHLPVVMLTAKDTKEAKLEGLQVGADAYVSKPFSMTELDVRINNILNHQRALKTRLKELSRFEGFDIPVTNNEQAFIEKILSVIQNNLGKSELDVQFIADGMNVSRSTLHYKMKLLLNMTVSEFINTVRINKAKDLIKEQTFSLSEIAYKVGYNDAAYFNRIFKKHTGKTPGEFRNG